MKSLLLTVALVLPCLCALTSSAQEPSSLPDKVFSFPSKLLNGIHGESTRLDAQLTRQTERYLQRLSKKEAKMRAHLYKIDSTAANRLFAGSAERYAQLIHQMKTDSGGRISPANGQYLPYMDSLKGSLSFLQQNNSLQASAAQKQQLTATLDQVNQLQNKLQDAEQAKQFIRERKQQLQDALSHYSHLPGSLQNSVSGYNKEAYYYAAQLQGYKDMFNNPDQLAQKALSLVNKVPGFQQFMQQHSQLAGLFSLPGSYSTAAQSLAGLQTRDQVSDLIVNQLGGGSGAAPAFQQQIQAAQGQLDQFKSRLGQSGDADITMPAGFVPNPSKTKTFLKKLVLGTDLQTQHSTIFYPTVTDCALTVAYKPSDKIMAGIGASVKIGWGQDIRHVSITVPGFGLRSFIDIKAVKSFYASGGLEYNYLPVNPALTNKYQVGSWTQSALIGVSKIVSMKSKFFKKTKLSLLWDMLSYRQQPSQNPVKFRVGYVL